ncbi:MAG TPA: ATP synthase F1 subunit epsilon [Acidimicrobiales bacterium]|nr:ATP synthase F1 subunit epsilon [Acidimicrobiales bacterium]
MQVELVSPERILFSGEAEMVICRAEGGDIAFLDHHAPFLGALDIGEVRIIRQGQPDERAAVHGGFVEVRDNRVIILSDVAELASQIDINRAREAKAKAEEQLRAAQDAECEAALRRAHVRLEVADAA